MLRVGENYLKQCLIHSIMHQEYDGSLNFATDAWTSPNHRAFIAITVHLELNGKPVSLLLDIVELPKVSYIPIF